MGDITGNFDRLALDGRKGTALWYPLMRLFQRGTQESEEHVVERVRLALESEWASFQPNV